MSHYDVLVKFRKEQKSKFSKCSRIFSAYEFGAEIFLGTTWGHRQALSKISRAGPNIGKFVSDASGGSLIMKFLKRGVMPLIFNFLKRAVKLLFFLIFFLF